MDSVDRDFQRFQRAGDPAALAAVFEATAPGLLRLAESVVRDAGVAEDLVQETFLIAISRRGNWRRESGVRSWLTGILVRRGHKRRRSDARRPDPLRLPGVRVVDPAEATACAELRDAVQRAIASLSEPYEPLVRAHLERGLRPVEIAREAGRSPDVVRKQLARGMELLRRRLPAGVAGALAVSLRSQRGLDVVRAEVLAAARGLPPTADAGPGRADAPAAATGSMVRPVLAWAGAALVLAGIATWWAVAVASGRPLVRLGGDEIAAGAVVGGAGAPTTANRVAVADVRGDPREPAAGAIGEIAVTVTEDDGLPPGRVGVVAIPRDGRDATRGAVRGVTDTSGRLRLALAPGRWEVRLDRFREGNRVRREVVVTPGASRDARFTVDRGFAVDGRVLDAEGRPVAGAAIWRHDHGERASDHTPPEHSHPVATTDAAGRFRVDGIHESSWLQARHPGLAASMAVLPRIPPIVARPCVELRLRGPAAVLRGRVSHAGDPVAGAEVVVRWPRSQTRTLWQEPAVGRRQSHVARRLAAAADGTFVVDDLAPGEVEVFATAPGHAPARAAPRLEAGRTVTFELESCKGGGLAVTTVDPRGRAVVGARVSIATTAVVAEGFTDGAGCVRFDGLEPGRYEVRLDPGTHFGKRAVAVVEAEAVVQLRVQLEPLAEIRGRVFDPRGAPWPDRAVFCVRSAASTDRGEDPDRIAPRAMQRTWTDRDGRFQVWVVPGGAYRLAVCPAPDARPVELAAWRGLVAPCDGVELRVPAELGATGWIEVRLTDAIGSPLRGVEFADPEGWPLPARALDDLGGYRIGPLGPGGYRILAQSLAPRFSLALGELELDPGVRLDLGVLAMPGDSSLARVDCRIRAATGEQVEDAHLGVRTADGEVFGSHAAHGTLVPPPSVAADAAGRAVVVLPPGRYRLLASAGGCRTRVVTVDLTGGARWDREFLLPPAVVRTVRVDPPAGVARGTVAMTGPDGTPLGIFDDRLPARGGGRERPAPDAFALLLEPGPWSVEFRADDGSRWTGGFVVAAAEAGDDPIELVRWTHRTTTGRSPPR